jgi:hypothetical protein
MKLYDIINKNYHDNKINIGELINQNYENVKVRQTPVGDIVVFGTKPGTKTQFELLVFKGFCVSSYESNSKLWMWHFNNYMMSKKNKEKLHKIKEFSEKIRENDNQYEDKKFVERVYNETSREFVSITLDRVHHMVKLIKNIFECEGVIETTNDISDLVKKDFFVIERIIVNKIDEDLKPVKHDSFKKSVKKSVKKQK